MNEVVESISNLNVWKRGDQRAPHKPLLLLYVLSRYLDGAHRLIPYQEIDEPLTELLVNFGPPSKNYHPEYPFWYLHSEDFWELQNVIISKSGVGGTTITKSKLKKQNAKGGFTEESYKKIQDPYTAAEVISTLLYQNFPETIHEDILRAVGINFNYLKFKRRRDPKFREEILRAYQYQCAICGFTSQIGQKLAGVEAAHIKWHQAGGPDTHPNGIALCSLHHKLFDLGMITLDRQGIILVSETAHGSQRFEELVKAFHGSKLITPARHEYEPAEEYVHWHYNQVFHPPVRYQA